MNRSGLAAVLMALSACTPVPALRAEGPLSGPEVAADPESSAFRDGIIYDCDLAPDADSASRGATPLRQILYDEDGAPRIAYCEPTGTDATTCFQRSVEGGLETFDIDGYKRLTIGRDGSARLTLFGPQLDPLSFAPADPGDYRFAGTCRHGPAYPDGVVAARL